MILTCLGLFLFGYVVNMALITVFYHRGLAHRAIRFPPRVEQAIGRHAIWFTGIDPKAWICMHRLHHVHSDTARDPHTPVVHGILPIFLVQLRSYERILRKLIRRDSELERVVADLPFSVHWLNRRRLWALPYLAQAGVALVLAAAGGPWVGLAYWLGMMSHPVQGWLVNAFGHAVGYRNFGLDDNSRNNMPVALLVFGEGYQNNHHRFPQSAKFSVKGWELDPGWILVLLVERLGLGRVQRSKLATDVAAEKAA